MNAIRPTRKRALFLDRDGTLIVDVGYPRDPARVQLLPGAVDALRTLQQQWLLVIVTNQSGVGRGMISLDEATAVQSRTNELFAAHGVAFTGVEMCVHAPEAACACRKPAPGLLLAAAQRLGIDLTASAMVGDKVSDVEAGLAAGCAIALQFAGASPALSASQAMSASPAMSASQTMSASPAMSQLNLAGSGMVSYATPPLPRARVVADWPAVLTELTALAQG